MGEDTELTYVIAADQTVHVLQGAESIIVPVKAASTGIPNHVLTLLQS